MASSDPFDDLLNLEDNFYSEGYKQGVADGDRAGRIEGRSFGIEKGFEKFVEAGRLYGKSIVWANRLPTQTLASSSSLSSSTTGLGTQGSPTATDASTTGVEKNDSSERLPGLNSGGARLEKNIVTLYALVELDTLSTENTDDAVNDFDDRLKRAQGKSRVIERHVGEDINLNTSGKKEAKKEGGGGELATERKSGGGGNQPPASSSKEDLSF